MKEESGRGRRKRREEVRRCGEHVNDDDIVVGSIGGLVVVRRLR